MSAGVGSSFFRSFTLWPGKMAENFEKLFLSSIIIRDDALFQKKYRNRLLMQQRWIPPGQQPGASFELWRN